MKRYWWRGWAVASVLLGAVAVGLPPEGSAADADAVVPVERILAGDPDKVPKKYEVKAQLRKGGRFTRGSWPAQATASGKNPRPVSGKSKETKLAEYDLKAKPELEETPSGRLKVKDPAKLLLVPEKAETKSLERVNE